MTMPLRTVCVVEGDPSSQFSLTVVQNDVIKSGDAELEEERGLSES